MRKMFLKVGNVIATLALVAATVNVNSTCWHFLYQDKLPESAKNSVK